MYHHLQGRLIEKNPAYIVIECAGVGYFVNISVHTYSKIGDNENFKILTYLQITEDQHALYGFADEEERRLFRLLITVSGVGCNTARMMLSSMNPGEIESCILQDDAPRLKAIKGIGEKTAQRIILELKSKLRKDVNAPSVSVASFKVKDEALTALLTLGFPRASVEKTLDSLVRQQPTAGVEDLIRLALKNL